MCGFYDLFCMYVLDRMLKHGGNMDRSLTSDAVRCMLTLNAVDASSFCIADTGNLIQTQLNELCPWHR